MICSLGECGELIVGTCVVLGDTTGDLVWPNQIPDSHIYYGENPDTGGRTSWIALHPNCFKQLFDEMMRQEGLAAMTFIFGAVGEVKDALGMTTT